MKVTQESHPWKSSMKVIHESHPWESSMRVTHESHPWDSSMKVIHDTPPPWYDTKPYNTKPNHTIPSLQSLSPVKYNCNFNHCGKTKQFKEKFGRHILRTVTADVEDAWPLLVRPSFDYPIDFISLRFNWYLKCSWPLSCVLPHCQMILMFGRCGKTHNIEAKNTSDVN